MKFNKHFFLSPWTAFISMFLGIAFGIYFPNTFHYTEQSAIIYVYLLKMVVLGMLPVVVITNVGRLTESKNFKKILKNIAAKYTILLMATSLIALTASSISVSFNLTDFQVKKTIGKIMVDREESFPETENSSIFLKEIKYSGGERIHLENWMIHFVKSIIPENIFLAMAKGDVLKIIFFSIIFGIMLGNIGKIYTDKLLEVSDSILSIFENLMNVLKIILPFGAFAVLASEWHGVDFNFVSVISELILLYYIICFTLLLGAVLIIWRRTASNPIKIFMALKEAFLISFISQEALNALPSTIKGLSALNIPEENSKLVMPLGLGLIDFGFIVESVVGAIFTLGIYDIPLNLYNLFIILFGAIICSFSALGTPGIIKIVAISTLLTVLELPATAIIIVFFIIAPLTDSLTSVVNVALNCATCSLMSKKINIKTER